MKELFLDFERLFLFCFNYHWLKYKDDPIRLGLNDHTELNSVFSVSFVVQVVH